MLAVITIVVIYNIVNSDIGRALISIREDELAAQAMGVNTTRYKVTLVCDQLSVRRSRRRALRPLATAASERLHVCSLVRNHHHDRARRHGLDYGRGAGRVGDHILPELLRQLPGGVYNYRLVIYALMLIIIMITRPQGILG